MLWAWWGYSRQRKRHNASYYWMLPVLPHRRNVNRTAIETHQPWFRELGGFAFKIFIRQRA